jgi:hypothetical protein
MIGKFDGHSLLERKIGKGNAEGYEVSRCSGKDKVISETKVLTFKMQNK